MRWNKKYPILFAITWEKIETIGNVIILNIMLCTLNEFSSTKVMVLFIFKDALCSFCLHKGEHMEIVAAYTWQLLSYHLIWNMRILIMFLQEIQLTFYHQASVPWNTLLGYTFKVVSLSIWLLNSKSLMR